MLNRILNLHLLSDLHGNLCKIKLLGLSGSSDSSVMYKYDIALQSFISFSVTTVPLLSYF